MPVTSPAPHFVQELEPASVANVPAGHARQSRRLLSYLPAPHFSHEVAPMPVTSPAPHFVQELEPASVANVPAGHARQSRRLLSYLPAPHFSHEVATSREVEPAVQVVHDCAPTPEKVPAEHGVHAVLPSFELKVPAVQFLATELPAMGANVPAGASRHALADVAPALVANVPAGHARQSRRLLS